MMTLSPASSAPPLYYEKKVREKLHISAAQFRRIRTVELQLDAPDDVDALTTGAVTLTSSGLGRVLDFLRASQPGIELPPDFDDCLLEPPTEKKEPEPDAIELFVDRVLPNHRLIRCKLAQASAGAETFTVNVRVSNNRNFVPKMKLRAALHPDGHYQLVGRCPRKKGRY